MEGLKVVKRKIINTTRNIKSAKYRQDLPQLSDSFFLTDGGIETTLIFHNGFELPCFAAFDARQPGLGSENWLCRSSVH